MAGFMAGFAGTLSKSIEDDREYYREAATKRRDYIQTYGTKAVVDREDKANAALGTVNSLIGQGVPEEDVRYVVDTSGIQGLAQLSATLKSRSDLTKADIEGIVKKSKDYVAENPDEDINTVINRAYGLYQSTDKPVQRERNLLSAVLGLDSRMAEDEVMDDLYINGYTGRDIYRIMGSSGPKPGSPLSLNVPAKAPSSQILAASAKTLTSQFEASINGKINAAKAAVKDPDDLEAVKLVETLEALKAKGVEGIYEYATLEGYGDPALLTFAQRMEQEIPGTVTRNSINLGSFASQFTAGAGDAADDEAMAATQQPGQQQQPGSTAKVEAPSPANKTLTFPDAAAFTAAVERGEVINGDKVQVGDSAVKVFKMPENVTTPPAAPTIAGLMGVDAEGGSGTPDTFFNTPTAAEIVRPKATRASLEADAVADVEAIEKAATESVDAAVDAAGTFLRGADLKLGEGVAAFQRADSYVTAIIGAIAKRLGASKGATDMIFEHAARVAASGPRVEENGFFMQNAEAANEILQDEDSFVRQTTDKAMELLRAAGEYIPDQPGQTEDAYKAAIEEAQASTIPDTLRKAFGVIKENVTGDEPKGMERVVNDFTDYLRARLERPEPDEMEARIRDDRRQFAADERSYPQPLDTIVTELPNKIVSALSEESVREFVERGGAVVDARDALEAGLRQGARQGAEQLVAYLKKLKVSDEDVVKVLNAGGVPVKGRDALQDAAEAGVERLTEKLKEFKITEKDVQRVVDAFDSAVTGARDTTEAGLRAAPGSLVKLLRELDLDDTKLREVLEAGGFVVEARDFAEREIRKGLGVNPDRKPAKPTEPTGQFDSMSRDQLYDALENNDINLRDLDGAGVKALADRLKQLSN